MKKIIYITILLKLALFNVVLAEPELTAELKNGKEKALTICSACHGLNG